MNEGAERIVRRILTEARTEADAVMEETSRQSEDMLEAAAEEAEEKRRQIIAQGKKEAEEQRRRILGVAQLDARKEMLAAKQAIITESFNRALETLSNLDEEEYFSLIKEFLLSMVDSGSELVIFSARDQERMPPGLLKEINKALKKAGKKGALSLSGEKRDILGGFILQADGIEINCSFESLLESRRDELEPAVAGILFD